MTDQLSRRTAMAVVRLAAELRRADPLLSLTQATEQARKMLRSAA